MRARRFLKGSVVIETVSELDVVAVYAAAGASQPGVGVVR
jgi:hypothetical protein